MNCWHCGTELIWGADFDMDDINDGDESEYDFWSSFTCPKCESYVEVFHHKQMKIPNWQHHSKKELKRKLKPQALRRAKRRLQVLKTKLKWHTQYILYLQGKYG